MVNRTRKTRVSSESEDQSGSGSGSGSGSSSDSEDSTFVPEVRDAPAGRKRQRRTLDHTESDSDSEETTAVHRRRRRRPGQVRTESEDINVVPRRRRRVLQRGRLHLVEVESEREPEDTSNALIVRSAHGNTDSDDSGQGQGGSGSSRPRRRRNKKTRRNGKVTEAVWTPERTVRITYDIGVKHACMNPIHGKSKQLYKVLHLVKCSWRNNVNIMTDAPSIERSKLYQYCHKLCESCFGTYGARCFKCAPVQGDVTPILHTVFGSDAITCAEDFREVVRKWQEVGGDAAAKYMVLHCTVIGPEARILRRKFSLKRSTLIQVVYSDVRDRMELAGSGINLEESEFQDVWKTIMKEKVPAQKSSMVSFFGNILLNDTLSFDHFRVNDLLLMYEPGLPGIFNSVEENAIRVSINAMQMPALPYVQTGPSESCLHGAAVHVQREPTSEVDDLMLQHGNLAASLFYKGIKRCFGHKIVSEFEQRAGLGEALRIGDEGHKMPFLKLFAAKGGEVRFRKVSNATQGPARSDVRSQICGWDTSGFELVCWTHRGHPVGGDFVIPGLMYRFEVESGSSLIFRPTRYFHATLPTQNRDLKNEIFAAAFVTPT